MAETSPSFQGRALYGAFKLSRESVYLRNEWTLSQGEDARLQCLSCALPRAAINLPHPLGEGNDTSRPHTLLFSRTAGNAV
jgi:hypothetical protein